MFVCVFFACFALCNREREIYPYACANLTEHMHRMMYVHSYQSYVWNNMASKRLEKYGPRIVVGDVVLEKSNDLFENQTSVTEDEGVTIPDDRDERDVVEEEEKKDTGFRTLPSVKIVTEEDIQNVRYTLDDVVLPLPGTDVTYPSNEIGRDYSDILAADGLDINSMRRSQKEFNLPGEYRRLISKPKDLEWKIFKYERDDEQLCPTDLDLIKGFKIPDMESPDRHTGHKVALVLAFSLPSCCYATMLLRELLKQSTESMTGKV